MPLTHILVLILIIKMQIKHEFGLFEWFGRSEHTHNAILT